LASESDHRVGSNGALFGQRCDQRATAARIQTGNNPDMNAAQIAVTLIGLGLIIFTLWFFFGPRKVVAVGIKNGGIQGIEILVKGGYSPDRIEVQQGRPVRLNFRREETTACTEQVILPDFGISRDLPFGQTTPVEFTPDTAGEFVFHCGMNMVRGKLVVRPG
jgi:plastocyanin domain-containing protein